MGAFSTMFQMPHGQAPAQKPQAMHRSAETTYSKRPSGAWVRLMALSGQTATQSARSRHWPHEGQAAAMIQILVAHHPRVVVFQVHPLDVDDRARVGRGPLAGEDVIDGLGRPPSGADGVGEQAWPHYVTDGEHLAVGGLEILVHLDEAALHGHVFPAGSRGRVHRRWRRRPNRPG